MVPAYCIGLANIATGFVFGQPSFFERTSNADKAFVVCPLTLRFH